MTPTHQAFGKTSAELLQEFGKDLERLKDRTFESPRAVQYEGRNFQVNIVLRDESDLIYQWFMKSFPKDFPTMLSAAVEGHFGSVDKFALDWVPEVKSYALLGRGLWDNPLRDELFLTSKFCELVDDTLDELKARA